MADEADPRVRYRFSPLERRGIIAGWRGGQIASVACSLVLAVLFLRARPSPPGLTVAIVAVTAGVTVAFWPIRGRTAEQWFPLVSRWVAQGPVGRLQLAPGPRRGHVVSVGRPDRGPAVGPATSDSRRHRLGPFVGLRIVSMSLGTDPASASSGVVIDEQARTATAVLAARGQSFALLSSSDQHVRVSAWASVLASLAREGSALHRLQWIESCVPDGGDAVRRHFEEHRSVASTSEPASSYRTLMEETRPATRRHRVLLGVSVSTRSARRGIRARRDRHRDDLSVLGREVASLQRALEGADVWVDGVLGAAALSGAVHDAVSPFPSGDLDTVDAAAARPTDGGGARQPWPLAVRPEWDAVRTDGTWHATYWIAEWPRVDVTPDFLGPLLFVPVRRSISLVMEPMSPSRAARQVARARTEEIADDELRARSGFLVGARQRRERRGIEERDAELADGHGQFRFAGYVTVTATSRAALDASTATLEQVAGQSHLELRRLYGEQDVAFACSLPLGRGLP